MKQIVEVLYRCACLDEDVKVKVPARRGPAHDVTDWVGSVVASKVGADHAARSPACHADVMQYVKIPLPPEGGYVGQAG